MHRILTLGQVLFRCRSWTPVPLALWIVANAHPRRRWILPGILLASAGLALRVWAVAQIGPKSRTRGGEGPERRAVGGPYRIFDHPLYVANALLSGGLVVASGAGWPWLQVIFPWLWLAQYGPIMLWEDAKLRARFGDLTRRFPRPYEEAKRTDWRLAWRSERRTRQSVILFLSSLALTLLVRGSVRQPARSARAKTT